MPSAGGRELGAILVRTCRGSRAVLAAGLQVGTPSTCPAWPRGGGSHARAGGHHPLRAWAQHHAQDGCGAAGSSPEVGLAVTWVPAPTAWTGPRNTPALLCAWGQGGVHDALHPLAATGPFEDALKLHECIAGGGTSPPIEDQWPSPPTRKAPIAPTEEQLRREPWYHGKMSRRDAERLLQMDGDFLVRDSLTNPGQYVLTGMHSGQPKHLLLVDPEGVVRAGHGMGDGGRGGKGRVERDAGGHRLQGWAGVRGCMGNLCRRQLSWVQDCCAPRFPGEDQRRAV